MTLRPRAHHKLASIAVAKPLAIALFAAVGMTQPANAIPQYCIDYYPICGIVLGVAGGGSITVQDGEAQFSLFATTTTFEAEDDGEVVEAVTVGQVRWMASGDGDGSLLLESTTVEDYGPNPDVENGRIIRGALAVNGDGEYPFVVHAEANPISGELPDLVEIRVGDAVEGVTGTGFEYSAEGPLVTGDLQLL